jgi:hypothetical protein
MKTELLILCVGALASSMVLGSLVLLLRLTGRLY